MAEYIKLCPHCRKPVIKCDNCKEPCPVADMAHEAAKGRMYATNEFIALQKKIDSGQLVEVVRCCDCKHFRSCDEIEGESWTGWCAYGDFHTDDLDYCSRGERRTDEQ